MDLGEEAKRRVGRGSKQTHEHEPEAMSRDLGPLASRFPTLQLSSHLNTSSSHGARSNIYVLDAGFVSFLCPKPSIAALTAAAKKRQPSVA